MSPIQFKKIRESFNMTQDEFSSCLGLAQKTVSQYEMGFRKPGPTVKIIVKALELLPATQAKKLLDLMREVNLKNLNNESRKEKP